ncbi:Zn-ribbon domain-containing OB-fold protein [Celeribacter sp. HF31]|uniref:Zn-ribbon domain-containing OB-fold protein n=1 Tax=Celeribacter sp. HF31 TaxID=2721558 RepID=UPI001C375BE3|nr:OB-fold domain-containing protein [Celeribacter sp. HF31]
MSVEMPEQNPITAPEPTAETAAYWDAADEGRLVLKRCLGTGKAFHPPRKISPFTGRDDTDWIEAEGTGEVYALSVSTRQGAEHCIAYIALTEGPIILSALTRCDLSAAKIGQRVRVVFEPCANGRRVPMFTTVATD